jgi:hypothetical protein
VSATEASLDSKPVVLKMMKSKHEVNACNLDRHRHNGPVMELSSLPYVVDMYAYCANLVVIEYLPMTLESTILDNSTDDQGKHGQTKGATVSGHCKGCSGTALYE